MDMNSVILPGVVHAKKHDVQHEWHVDGPVQLHAVQHHVA